MDMKKKTILLQVCILLVILAAILLTPPDQKGLLSGTPPSTPSPTVPAVLRPTPTLLALSTAAPTTRPALVEAAPTPAALADPIGSILAQINPDRLLLDLQYLSGEKPVCSAGGCQVIKNRLTGSQGLQAARDYVSAELSRLGYTVHSQDWSMTGYADQNLVAVKAGAADVNGAIYLVAHLDGVKPVGEERFPAADDNASGVVSLLETARVLSSLSFNRTIIFLITSGEEQGTLGALSYLDQLPQSELSQVKAALNVDMVGYDTNQDGVMELWHAGHAPSIALAEVMSDTIQTYGIRLAPRFIVGCG